MAAGLLNEDFEVGDLSLWSLTQTNGAVSLTRGIQHSGLYGVMVTGAGSVTALAGAPFASSPVAYARIFFYIPPSTSVTGDVQILHLYNNSQFAGQRLYIRNSGGALYLKLEGQATAGTTAITRGAWHSAELMCNSTSGTAAVYLDASTTAELTASGLTFGNLDAIRFGAWGSMTGALYFDDAVVNSSLVGAPAVNITVRHANSAARSALPLQSILWGWAATDLITLEVDGAEVSRKPVTSGKETPVVNMAVLNAGNHTVTVKLLAAGGAPKAQVSESIRKYVDGTAAVSIDADNNLVSGGSKVFPVTPFEQNLSDWTPYWNNGWVNMYGWASGYATTWDPTQYQSFLGSIGHPAIGPDDRFCTAGDNCFNDVNAVSLASAYATNLKDHPLVFGWTWGDEPDLGGLSAAATARTNLLAISSAVRNIDGNHPQFINLYGYDIQGTRQKGFLYPTLIGEVFSFDMYPMMNYPKHTITEWVGLIDRFQMYNYGLTPWMTFVEAGIQPCSDPPICTGGKGPTPAQMRMEAWLAVIHGIKGISWWGPEGGAWTYIDAAHHAEMARFVDQIARTKDAILSTPPNRTVISTATTAGNRVDTTVRQNAGKIWVFTARVTEPGETNTLTPQFTVSGLPGVATVNVFDENRTLTAVDGVFTDSFAPSAVHIYTLTVPDLAPPQNLQISVK